MRSTYRAKIYWLTAQEGGRKEMPKGDKYAPIINVIKPLFESVDYWSVFVVNIDFLSENETISEIRYLSEMAPDNLDKNVEFELREGNKMVASGIVLDKL